LLDDHIDPYTAVQSVPMSPNSSVGSERRVLHDLHSNLSQPNFSDSGGSDLMTGEKGEERLVLSQIMRMLYCYVLKKWLCQAVDAQDKSDMNNADRQ